jgi:hypothetical protein
METCQVLKNLAGPQKPIRRLRRTFPETTEGLTQIKRYILRKLRQSADFLWLPLLNLFLTPLYLSNVRRSPSVKNSCPIRLSPTAC